jgi:hypothetical protein
MFNIVNLITNSKKTQNPFQRKFRKLLLNPKMFIEDSIFFKFINKGRNVTSIKTSNTHATAKSIEPSQSTNKLGSSEPRIFAKVSLIKNGFLNIENYKRRVNHTNYSTLLFLKRKERLLINEKFFRFIYKNSTNFIGFREKTFFVVDLNYSCEYLNQHLCLQDKSIWRTSPFAEFKNMVFIDPQNELPFFIRDTHHSCNIILILTENFTNFSFITEHANNIDALVHHTSLKVCKSSIRKVYHFDHEKDIEKILKSIVIAYSPKVFDMLIPVYGNVPYLDNIDELNQNNIGGYIRLNNKISTTHRPNSLNEYIDLFSQNVDFMLMRESITSKYSSSCMDQTDLKNILSFALDDAVNFEVDYG